MLNFTFKRGWTVYQLLVFFPKFDLKTNIFVGPTETVSPSTEIPQTATTKSKW